MSVADLFRGTGVIPAVFLGSVAISMTFSAIPDLVMEKTCSPEGEPEIDFICNNSVLVGHATAVATSRNAVRSVLSAVSLPIFAYWRDATGRSKPLILFGLVAETIGALMYLVATLDWAMSPWSAAMVEAAFGGLFGVNILHLGASCIIIDKSTSENRTIRLQLYMSAMFVSTCLASTAYGFILARIGYGCFFTMVAMLQIVAITLVVVFLRDKKKVSKKREGLCREMKAVFESRPNRAVIWIMVVCGSIVETHFSAESSILIYYLQQAFQFRIQEEGLFDAYYSLISATGSLVFPLIATKVLKWTDIEMGIVSALLTSISGLFIAFATTKTQLYIFSVLGLLKYVLYSIPESVISKCVKNHELGKFLGISAFLETFLVFGVNGTYSYVFSSTSSFLPGAFYLISATASFTVFILFSISSCLFQPTENGGHQSSEDNGNSSAGTEPVRIWVIDKFHK